MMFYYNEEFKIVRCPLAEIDLACNHPWHYLTQEHARAEVTREALREAHELTLKIERLQLEALQSGDLELAVALEDVV